MRESDIRNKILIFLSQKLGCCVFTNPMGTGWVGKFLRMMPGGQVLLEAGARRTAFGLHKGSPDIIGWRSTEITTEHVGKRLAIFVGVEVKSDGGRLEPEQKQFLERLAADGALSGIARNNQEAE